jgi:hypothetical protein
MDRSSDIFGYLRPSGCRHVCYRFLNVSASITVTIFVWRWWMFTESLLAASNIPWGEIPTTETLCRLWEAECKNSLSHLGYAFRYERNDCQSYSFIDYWLSIGLKRFISETPCSLMEFHQSFGDILIEDGGSSSTETLVKFYQTTQCHNPDNSNYSLWASSRLS